MNDPYNKRPPTHKPGDVLEFAYPYVMERDGPYGDKVVIEASSDDEAIEQLHAFMRLSPLCVRVKCVLADGRTFEVRRTDGILVGEFQEDFI